MRQSITALQFGSVVLGGSEEWSGAGGRKISGENMASHCEREEEGDGGRKGEEKRKKTPAKM